MFKKNNVPVCPYHFPIIYGLWMSLTCFWSDGCKICEGSVGVELCVALHPLVSGNVEDQLVKIVCFGSFWGVKFWRTIFKILHFSNSAFIEFIAFRQHGQEHLEAQTPTSTPSMKLNRMSSAVAGGRFLLPYIDIYWHISYIPQWSSILNMHIMQRNGDILTGQNCIVHPHVLCWSWDVHQQFDTSLLQHGASSGVCFVICGLWQFDTICHI